jgi:hypothetical protein
MIEAYVALIDKLLLGARENANSGRMNAWNFGISGRILIRETLENPGHPRENAAVIAGADWVHGQQAARIWRLRAGHG